MENITFLGTGNATVKHCFNTCFTILKNEEFLLVDAGGGNGVLTQLDAAKIPLTSIHEMILTHCHTDHILGAVWIFRMIATAMKNGKYEGNFTIHCHDECEETLKTIVKLTVQGKFYKLLGERIFIDVVKDGDVREILDMQVTFFDILSTKAKQFGFMIQDGQTLTCLGDEPCNINCQKYVKDADYLLSEAFCLYDDRDIFKPYEKHHSTVKEASELAEELQVRTLILYHTEETHLSNRKELYTKEAQQYFRGNIVVPNDLETIQVK